MATGSTDLTCANVQSSSGKTVDLDKAAEAGSTSAVPTVSATASDNDNTTRDASGGGSHMSLIIGLAVGIPAAIAIAFAAAFFFLFRERRQRQKVADDDKFVTPFDRSGGHPMLNRGEIISGSHSFRSPDEPAEGTRSSVSLGPAFSSSDNRPSTKTLEAGYSRNVANRPTVSDQSTSTPYSALPPGISTGSIDAHTGISSLTFTHSDHDLPPPYTGRRAE